MRPPKKVHNRHVEKRSKTEKRDMTSNVFFPSLFTAPTNVTMNTDPLSNPTASYCINLISNTVASTDLRHVETKDDFETPIKGSQLSKLLKHPNSYQSFTKIMYQSVKDMVHRGNWYIWIIRDDNGTPTSLIHVPQSSVSPYETLDLDNPYYFQVSYQGQTHQVFIEDMIHLAFPDSGSFLGIDPMSRYLSTYNIGSQVSNFSNSFLQNSTGINAVIETETDPDEDTVQDFKRGFERSFAGSANAGKVPVMAGGWKFKDIKRSSPLDADLMNIKKLTKEDISEIYGVPLALLGTNGQQYNDAQDLYNIFQNNAINPILKMIEEEISLKLIPSYKRTTSEFRFYVDILKMATVKEKGDQLSLWVNTKMITPNEARNKLNMSPIEGGDELIDTGSQEQSPKNTDSDATGTGTNSDPSDPRTDSNNQPSQDRSLDSEDLDKEIQRLRSTLGRLEKRRSEV